MGRTGKRYDDAAAQVQPDQMYSASEALGLAASLAGAKFDEGIDLVIRLSVDPRKSDEMVRGQIGRASGRERV